MGKAQIEKFARVQDALRCPLCGEPVRLAGTALRCERGHAASVAAKGYANFVPNQRPLKGYDRAFFESRRRFLEAGPYRHVRDAVLDVLRGLDPLPRRVLDAGCGEGYYARAVAELLGAVPAAGEGAPAPAVFALDIAKDALAVAARGGTDVLWLVADIARIPLAAASVDCVLDVFTPANYAEFNRVLVPGGALVKVVPGARHLAELRHAARGLIRSEGYSNERVADYFAEHYAVDRRLRATATVELGEPLMRDLFAMTPLLFGASEDDLAALSVPRITIDAEILVARRP